jgi:hypothetical protein
MLILFRPSFEVVEEGRIFKNQIFTKPLVRVFLFGASLVPGLE